MIINSDTPILETKALYKSYGGNPVIRDLSIDLMPGKIITLVGENGAGKSTLINILSGLVQPDQGELIFNGEPRTWSTPKQALKAGIAVVHQELTLFPNLSVAENIFIGNDNYVSFGKLDRKRMEEETTLVLNRLGLSLQPDTLVRDLTVAEQQIVEIAKAFIWNPNVLILDEATSALDNMQTEYLFKHLAGLKNSGVSILFVSHRMSEVMAIADQAYIIKDGVQVGYYDSLEHVSEEDIISKMLGFEIDAAFPKKRSVVHDEILLSTHNLTTNSISDVSMTLRVGEIVGIGGLRGHGQEELLRTLFGLNNLISGTIMFNSNLFQPKNVQQAIKNGIAYVPPDRKTEGLILNLPIESNLTITILEKLKKLTVLLDLKKETTIIQDKRTRLNIRQYNWHQEAWRLSGGNQQKVVLGKWLNEGVLLLLMDEPTRGVDVATKHEIYVILRELAAKGLAILFVSTEIHELVGLSDRVYVFYDGKIQAELTDDDINEEKLTYAIMGIGEKNAS